MRIRVDEASATLNRLVLDVVYILVAIALIAVVALVGKAVERL